MQGTTIARKPAFLDTQRGEVTTAYPIKNEMEAAMQSIKEKTELVESFPFVGNEVCRRLIMNIVSELLRR